jgi:hypothetical protein
MERKERILPKWHVLVTFEIFSAAEVPCSVDEFVIFPPLYKT